MAKELFFSLEKRLQVTRKSREFTKKKNKKQKKEQGHHAGICAAIVFLRHIQFSSNFHNIRVL